MNRPDLYREYFAIMARRENTDVMASFYLTERAEVIRAMLLADEQVEEDRPQDAINVRNRW